MSDFSTPYTPDSLEDMLGEDPEYSFQDFSLQGGGLYNYNRDDVEFDTAHNFSIPLERLPRRSRDQFPELSLPLRVIKHISVEASMSSHDRILDIGSGKGRLAVMLHTLTGAQVRGIEIEPSYVTYARERTHNFSGISFETGDATKVEFQDENIICLINPFRGALMENLLTRIHTYYLEKKEQDSDSSLKIISQGICSFHLQSKPWLKQVGSGDGILSVGIFELCRD